MISLIISGKLHADVTGMTRYFKRRVYVMYKDLIAVIAGCSFRISASQNSSVNVESHIVYLRNVYSRHHASTFVAHLYNNDRSNSLYLSAGGPAMGITVPSQLWMSRQPVAEQRCQCQRVFIGRWEVTWRGTCRGCTQCDVIDWASSAEECANCWCPVPFYYTVVCLCSCFGDQWIHVTQCNAVADSSETNIFHFAEKLLYV